jgi:hypothetical protein
MRSATARALSLGLLLLAGCKPDPFRPDAGPPDAPDIDAPEYPWWTPGPGEIRDWDIQLAKTPFNVMAKRAMYIIDLFDAVPAATTLDYSSGMLTVPPGVHAGAITQLKGTTPPTLVVCHVNTGAVRLSDPDAMKFPGYEANPPDAPALPAANSVIGWSIGGEPGERYIDLNAEARATVLPLIEKRFELAQKSGCDAILAGNNGALISSSTGFPTVDIDENKSWMEDLAAKAHARTLSIGIRNSVMQSTDVDAQAFDWALVERCGEEDMCNLQRAFLNQHKAVFAVDYTVDINGDPTNQTNLCTNQAEGMIQGGIIKTPALDSTPPVGCP